MTNHPTDRAVPAGLRHAGQRRGGDGTLTRRQPAERITITRTSDALAEIITVTGEIDIATYLQLRAELLQAVDEGTGSVVVNMAAVEWIDSTGLGTLVGALKRAREKHGTVQVAAVPSRIAKHFQVTGLAALFGMHPSVEAALAVMALAGQTVPGGERKA